MKHWWNDTGRVKPMCSGGGEGDRATATLSTTNPTRTVLGLNKKLPDERPMIKYLSHDTVWKYQTIII